MTNPGNNDIDDDLWDFGDIPLDLDEAQAYHNGLMIQSDPKELAQTIDSVVSEIVVLETLECQKPSNEAEKPTDLEHSYCMRREEVYDRIRNGLG